MAQSALNSWETLFSRALAILDSAGEDVSPESWTFGGGTVLMRRHRHRMSKDIDIFVPDPQYLGYVSPRLNEAAEEMMPKYLEQAKFVKIYFPEGEIDFIVSPMLTDAPTEVETILGRQVRVETSAEIVAKKIRFRGWAFTARDIFDLAMVLEREPDVLTKIQPMLREQRQVIEQRLNSSTEILKTTFAELDTLEYRRSYEECVARVNQALASVT